MSGTDPGPAYLQSWKLDMEGRVVYVPGPDSDRGLRVGDVMNTPDGIEVCTSIVEPATWVLAVPGGGGGERCSSCHERQARHAGGRADEEPRRLCCACNYAETGIAADWHPDCVAAAEAAKGSRS